MLFSALLLLTLSALPEFRQVEVGMLDAQRVINKDGGVWVAEKQDDLKKLMPDKFPTDKPVLSGVMWRDGEVLVVAILKLKVNADVTVTSCKWDEDGIVCLVRYKLGPEKKGVGLVIGGKRIEADSVTQSFGIITKRPRQKTTVHLIADDK